MWLHYNCTQYSFPRSGETPEIAGVEKDEPAQPKSSLARAMEGITSTFGGGEEKKENKPSFSVMADNLLPKIRRGVTGERKEDAVVVGWKADVRSRKQREEVLRYVLLVFLNRPSYYTHVTNFIHCLLFSPSTYQ